MRNGVCENGDSCKFAHISGAEAKRLGIEPPKGGKGGRKGKAAAATGGEQQSQGSTTQAMCCPRVPTSVMSAQGLSEVHRAQEEAAAAYAAEANLQ